jgi:hypothetical protein
MAVRRPLSAASTADLFVVEEREEPAVPDTEGGLHEVSLRPAAVLLPLFDPVISPRGTALLACLPSCEP